MCSEHLPVVATFELDVLTAAPKYDADIAPVAIVFADISARYGCGGWWWSGIRPTFLA